MRRVVRGGMALWAGFGSLVSGKVSVHLLGQRVARRVTDPRLFGIGNLMNSVGLAVTTVGVLARPSLLQIFGPAVLVAGCIVLSASRRTQHSATAVPPSA